VSYRLCSVGGLFFIEFFEVLRTFNKIHLILLLIRVVTKCYKWLSVLVLVVSVNIIISILAVVTKLLQVV